MRHIEALAGPARSALSDAVSLHADHLLALVPRLASGWLPRTDDRVSVPLAGGRIVLQGVFDLLIGVPAAGQASLCAMAVSTGGPWPKERRSLHYLALLETLRSGTPPFRLALLESASGRYGVEDVREEHLVAMASHVAAWLCGGGGGAERVAETLTEVLLAPARPVDEVAWCSALTEARRVLARVAVRRAGAGTFRVTDHEVRVALSHGGGAAEEEPFAWSARTARRSLGLAAVRTLVAGMAHSPAEAVRARVAESSELVRDGSPAVSGLDRWLAGLAPAGRAAVGAAAVTWASPAVVRARLGRLRGGARDRTRPLVGQPGFGAAGAAGPGRGANRRRESGGVVGPPA